MKERTSRESLCARPLLLTQSNLGMHLSNRDCDDISEADMSRLVTDHTGVSPDELIQVLVRKLRASMAFEPQRMSKGVRLGLPKHRPHDPITIHERVDDDPVVA